MAASTPQTEPRLAHPRVFDRVEQRLPGRLVEQSPQRLRRQLDPLAETRWTVNPCFFCICSANHSNVSQRSLWDKVGALSSWDKLRDLAIASVSRSLACPAISCDAASFLTRPSKSPTWNLAAARPAASRRGGFRPVPAPALRLRQLQREFLKLPSPMLQLRRSLSHPTLQRRAYSAQRLFRLLPLRDVPEQHPARPRCSRGRRR